MWKAKFQSLEGWFEHGPTFATRRAAVSFALDFANSNTRVIDFDVVRA
jgi:hypothetical protein